MNLLLTSVNNTDRGLRFSLHSSCILSLTALAQTTYMLAMNSSTKDSATEFRQRCKDALMRAIALVGELEPDEFCSLDHVFIVGAFNVSRPGGTLQPAHTCSFIGPAQ
jgi:hypothetical protein